MPFEQITCPGLDDASQSLRLTRPAGPHLGTALLVQATPAADAGLAMARIAGRLVAMGLTVAQLDLGHRSRAADALQAAETLAARGLPITLAVGHGRGAAACMVLARQVTGLRALCLLAPAGLTPPGADPGSAWPAVPPPLLILQGLHDQAVSIAATMDLFAAAPHPKSLITLDSAGHGFDSPADADDVAGLIATWALRHLELRPPAPPPGMPEGIIRITEADRSGFLQHVAAGPCLHALADEPLAYGGSNRGMTPYGFLAAGLGACTAMTIRMYARRKGWPLADVRVDVSHDRMHAQDAHAGSDDRLEGFCRTIYLKGALSGAQRTRLLEVADRSPVARLLERSGNIRTVLA